MDQNNNYNYEQRIQQIEPTSKGKKIVFFIAIVAIIAIVSGIFLFDNGEKKETKNSNPSVNTQVENNTNEIYQTEENNLKNDVYSIGKVEEGTNTAYDANGAFLYQIEDVFSVTGRGTIATGTILRGTVNVGDTVQIVGFNAKMLTKEVAYIQKEGKELQKAIIGDNVGIVLKDTPKEDVKAGQVLAKPDSILGVVTYIADVHFLSREEGGSQVPIANGKRLEFYFGTKDITGVINFGNNIKEINPGEDTTATIELIYPVAMEVGTEFSIRQDGRTLAKGKVRKIS